MRKKPIQVFMKVCTLQQSRKNSTDSSLQHKRLLFSFNILEANEIKNIYAVKSVQSELF